MMYPLQRAAGPAAISRALDPRHLLARRNARRAAGRRGMARTMALNRGPASIRRDPDPVIVPGVCLGAATHESYRHTHAYLSFCRKESKSWEIPEKIKLKGQGEREGWRPGFVRSREREMLQAMGNVVCIHVFMILTLQLHIHVFMLTV